MHLEVPKGTALVFNSAFTAVFHELLAQMQDMPCHIPDQEPKTEVLDQLPYTFFKPHGHFHSSIPRRRDPVKLQSIEPKTPKALNSIC